MIWLLFCSINIFVITANVSNATNLQSSSWQNNVNGDDVRSPFSSGYENDDMRSSTRVVPDLSPYDGAKWRDIVHIEDNYNPHNLAQVVFSQIGF